MTENASGVAAPQSPDTLVNVEWADLRLTFSWVREHWVIVAGLVFIAAEVAWKASFLSHLYFRQDDFHDLDLAAQSPLSWHYLTFIGAGHLIIGLRIVAWLLVRASLYNWTLASAVSLTLVAAANLAALRVLRLLFGEHPAILIPLLVYGLSPLTFPDLGEWSSALESVPLQLAIFMALHAHIRYVRTNRTRHLAAAAAWVAVGLIFFEKGLALPLLLFAVTAGFLTGSNSLRVAALHALVKHWRAWLTYAVMMAGYLVLLARALHTSTTHPGAPNSSGAVFTFVGNLLKSSLLPGMIGGPWQWLAVPGGSYSFSAAAPGLIWVSIFVVAAIVLVSVMRRRVAWRAWAILIVWVFVADMLPVIFSRLGAFSPAVLGTETRYVADAVPVLIICLGLAFLPLDPAVAPDSGIESTGAVPQWWGNAAAIVLGVFVFGSIWSVQDYENTTTGSPAAHYIANATEAIKLAPRGTLVMNVSVPGTMVEGLFGPFSLESTVIGDIQPGKLRWSRQPVGTLSGLRIFGGNGKLYQASVQGVRSWALLVGQSCWPVRHGRIVIRFRHASPSYTGMLRIGYLWLSPVPATIRVWYGSQARPLAVQHGLNSAYVPVKGSANKITIVEQGATGLCVGDAEAGNPGPAPLGQVLPPPAK